MNAARTRRLELAIEMSQANKVISRSRAELFSQTGKLVVQNYNPAEGLYARGYGSVDDAARRLTRWPLPKSETVAFVGSHFTKRVTLVRESRSVSEYLTHGLRPYSKELHILAPWCDGIIRQLGLRLIELGKDQAGQLLSDYESTRVTVDRMRTRPNNVAELAPHVLPSEERGVSLDIIVDDLTDNTDKERKTRLNDGALVLYAAHDVASALGVEQPRRGYFTHTSGFAVAFSNYVECP